MKKIITVLSVLIAVVTTVTVGAGIYFTKISSETRIFRMSGQDIGPYQTGRFLMAEKITDFSSLKMGKGVLYTVNQEGKNITRVGIIYGLPGEENLGKNSDIGLDENHFLVGQNEDRMEIVEKSQIGWKIIRQF